MSVAFDFSKYMEEQKAKNLKSVKDFMVTFSKDYPDVTRIRAVYSGGGDEGGVDQIFLTRKDSGEEKLTFKSNGWEEASCAAMDATCVNHDGWWNNEGGFGEVIFNLASKRAFVSHNYYEQTSTSCGKVEIK
jgi:hypothetical protein